MTVGTVPNPYAAETRPRREERIVEHLPLVKRIAEAISRKLPSRIEVAELVSAGTLGLIRAVDAYDAARGACFEAFAGRCIREAVYDFLRGQDPLPYSTRVKIRRLDAAVMRLQSDLGRPPTELEVANEIECSEAEVMSLMTQATSVSLFSRRGTVDQDNEEGKWSLEHEDVLEAMARQEVEGILTDLIQDLPRSERLVLMLYYYEGLKMREIGEVLGVTESRVSQIHARALTIVRANMNNLL